MRAIVIEKPNDIALRDVETPTPGPGEVRVRSVLAGGRVGRSAARRLWVPPHTSRWSPHFDDPPLRFEKDVAGAAVRTWLAERKP